jgi:hypothetical protein
MARARTELRARAAPVHSLPGPGPARTSVQDTDADAGNAGPMRFDTKIAIAVRSDLAVWQKLNVTAFLASAIAAGIGEVAGKPYEDGSGNRYLEMFRQPVLVYTGPGETLAAARERAVSRNLPAAIYTEELFSTGDDDSNRAAVRAVAAEALTLAGIAVYGPRNAVDKVCRGLALHP